MLVLLSCEDDSDMKEPDMTSSDKQGFELFLEQLSQSDSKEELVQEFLDTLTQSPIIEGGEVYFIYYGSSSNIRAVFLAGDMNQWQTNQRMTQAYATNLYYYKSSFPLDARLDYKYVVDNGGSTQWLLDPRNPNTELGGFGPNSALIMPDYEFQVETISRSETDKGSLESLSLGSQFLAGSFNIQVYLPANYSTDRSYPTVYFQDGSDYLNLGRARIVLDNLIHDEEIEELIAVFVDPRDRGAEYAHGDRINYQRFFIEELIPYMDDNYRTSQDRMDRAVIGDSWGGNIAGLISFNHPDVIGNCGFHSGSFFPNDYELNQIIINEDHLNIKISSVWGFYEGGLTSNNRMIKDVLLSKSYDLQWHEGNEGHSWGFWKGKIDDALIHFFGK